MEGEVQGRRGGRELVELSDELERPEVVTSVEVAWVRGPIGLYHSLFLNNMEHRQMSIGRTSSAESQVTSSRGAPAAFAAS